MKNRKALVCDFCGKKFRLEFWFRKHVTAHEKKAKCKSIAIDPMEVLPPELVRHICSLLRVEDLVTLWEVNHCWREFVENTSLWRTAELNLSHRITSGCLKVLVRAPCVGRINFHHELTLRDKMKKKLLKTKTVVRRVNGLLFHDNGDFDWASRFIRHLSPNLEELSLRYFNKELLSTANTLPSLRKLHIEAGCDEALKAMKPLEVPDGFTGGLKCFTLEENRTLPYDLLISLLSAHSSTLEEVYICVGTRVDTDFKWPISCDIMDLLEKCDFQSLKHLILVRPSDLHHSIYPRSCPVQLAAVSELLPEVVVTCTICNGEEGRFFKEKYFQIYT